MLRIHQYSLQSAKAQMTLVAQTYHFCVAKKVAGSGDSFFSAYMLDRLNRSSYSDMWAQSKHSMACCLLHCKYNIYQYIYIDGWGHLPCVLTEANWHHHWWAVVLYGCTEVKTRIHLQVWVGSWSCFPSPSEAANERRNRKMDRNAAIVFLLHSCQCLRAHGDGDKRMHFQYCVGQCPLANTRKERTKQSTQRFQADLPEMYFSSIVAFTF